MIFKCKSKSDPFHKDIKFDDIKHITIGEGENSIILYNIIIASTNEDDCLVSLAGSNETVNSLLVNKINDTLTIDFPRNYTNNGVYNCKGSEGNLVALRDITENIDIIIKVRNLQSLSIHDTSIDAGRFLIKIPVGYLFINSTGMSSFEVEYAENAKIFISGNSCLKLKNLSSDLVGCITGSGNIDIDNGSPAFVDISISGSGNVNANITAKKAQLSISGSGSIMVEHVIEEVVEQQTGTGNIVVKKRGQAFTL